MSFQKLPEVETDTGPSFVSWAGSGEHNDWLVWKHSGSDPSI